MCGKETETKEIDTSSGVGRGRGGEETDRKRGGKHRDGIGSKQAVAVDVAIAYIALEVLVALAQSAVVEIRGEVVLVDSAVVVDIASLLHLAAWHLEYVHLGSRTLSALGFLYGHLDILCLWVALELVFLHGILVLPVEASCFCPVDAIVTDGELTLLNLSFSFTF